MSWAPPYASAAELASFIGEASPGGEDAQMALAIETASRSVDRFCNRQFGLIDAPESRWFSPVYDRDRHRWIVDTDDFMTTDGLVVSVGDGVTVTGEPLAGYLPTPVNAVANGQPWTRLILAARASMPSSAQLRVTATFGWAEVPPTIKLATLLQASRLFARRHAPFGVAGNLDVGQHRLLERIDADVAISVRPYRRVWGCV